MKQIIVKINTYEETIKLGELLTNYLYPSSFIALSGDLGAGKTTFTKGIGKVLGVKRTINSPTFTIMKNYPTNNFNDIKQLYHYSIEFLKSQYIPGGGRSKDVFEILDTNF